MNGAVVSFKLYGLMDRLIIFISNLVTFLFFWTFSNCVSSAGLAGGGLTGGRWATPSSQHAHTTTGITTTGGNTTGAANRAEPNEDSEPLNSSTGENPSPSTTEESRKVESTDDEKEGTGPVLHESSAGSKSLESVLRSLTLPVTQSVEVWAQSLSTAVQRATGNSVGGTAGFG